MKKILSLLILFVSLLNSFSSKGQDLVILQKGNKYNVVIDGRTYVRGYLGSSYQKIGSDSTLSILVNSGFPKVLYQPQSYQFYVNGDSLNSPFTSMLQLRLWMNSNFQYIDTTSGGGDGSATLDVVLGNGDTSSKNIVLIGNGSVYFPNTKYPGTYIPQGVFFGNTTNPTIWISEDSTYGKNRFHNYIIGQGSGNVNMIGGGGNISLGDSNMFSFNGFGNIAIGGHNFMSTNTPISVQQNTVIGFGSFAIEGGYAGTTGNQGAYNTVIGSSIAPTASNPSLNTLAGAFSCTALTNGSDNVVYGAQSFTSAKFVNGACVIGYGNSPSFNDTTGNSFSSLTSIGFDGSFRLKWGIENVLIGGKSINFAVYAADVVAIGNLVGSDADTIRQSTILGSNAGLTTENVDPHGNWKNRIMIGYNSYATIDNAFVIGSKNGDMKFGGIGWKETAPTAQFEIKCNPLVDTMFSIKDSLGRQIAFGTYSGTWVIPIKGNTFATSDSGVVASGNGTLKKYALPTNANSFWANTTSSAAAPVSATFDNNSHFVGNVLTQYNDTILTATDANYTSPATTVAGCIHQLIILPTPTAGRTLTLPAAGANVGKTLKIWCKSTSATNTWTFASTVKDLAGNTITNVETIAGTPQYILLEDIDASSWTKEN